MRRIAIIGGGAVGSSIAYHLASHPQFDGQITVVERDPTYRIASSSLSASSIRQQFSTPLNIAMSHYGFEFLRTGGERLEVDADRPALGLHHNGYLFMASESGLEVLRANHAVQKQEGADVALLSPEEIVARFPWMTADGVVEASLGLSQEGWFDGPALLAAFRRKARSLGVSYVAQEAVGLALACGRVSAVRLADGAEGIVRYRGERRRPVVGARRKLGRDRPAGAAEEADGVRDCVQDAAAGLPDGDRSVGHLYAARGGVLSMLPVTREG